MILSVSMVIIEKSFPLQYLGKAFGIYAVVTSAGLALGPAVGGIMNSLFGWRSIFLVNVPIGVLALLISCYTLKSNTTQEVKWDISGIVLQFVYLFLIIYSMNLIERADYTNAVITGIFAVAVFLTFIRTESRSENPMIKLNLFKNRVFSAFNICLHFNFTCMYMMLFIMPFYLEKVLHLSTGMSGMVLIASPLVMIIMGPVGGSLSDRLGSRIPIFLGSVTSVAALLLLSQLTVSSTIFDVFWRLGLLGLGAALFQPSANHSLMSIFPSKDAGMASGIIATVRNMGMVFAVCYGGLILNSAISPELMLQSQLFGSAALDLTTGVQRAMIFGAMLSTLMVILSFTGVKNKKTAISNHLKDIGESLEGEVNKLKANFHE
jgi:MFS family permease